MAEEIPKKPKIKYDLKRLEEIITRDCAIHLTNSSKYNQKTLILFRCNCGIEDSKIFGQIVIIGAYCKSCTIKRGKEKAIQTNLERYGCINPSQSKEIQDKIKKTNLLKYGNECSLKNEDVINKIKNTNIIKYGFENVFSNNQIKDKIKDTLILKYGVEHPAQADLIRKKTIDTNIQRFGVEVPIYNMDIKNKINNTNIIKYGVKFPFQNKEIIKKCEDACFKKIGVKNPLSSKNIREKCQITLIKNYGVEHALQSQEIMEKAQKNALKYKIYKFPNGITRKVQGYEPLALNELVKVYTEEQLKTDRKDVPRVEYMINDKKHFYFPDIWIPHENKLIEVKSTWTIKMKPETIMAKANSCKDKGYCFEIWVYDGKGGKEIILPDPMIINL
jgi:hypothetical protein